MILYSKKHYDITVLDKKTDSIIFEVDIKSNVIIIIFIYFNPSLSANEIMTKLNCLLDLVREKSETAPTIIGGNFNCRLKNLNY